MSSRSSTTYYWQCFYCLPCTDIPSISRHLLLSRLGMHLRHYVVSYVLPQSGFLRKNGSCRSDFVMQNDSRVKQKTCHYHNNNLLVCQTALQFTGRITSMNAIMGYISNFSVILSNLHQLTSTFKNTCLAHQYGCQISENCPAPLSCLCWNLIKYLYYIYYSLLLSFIL